MFIAELHLKPTKLGFITTIQRKTYIHTSNNSHNRQIANEQQLH